MPYTIRKRGRQWCVYKKVDERAVGEALGCHDTRAAAIEQIGAIESAENKAFIVKGSDGPRFMFLVTSNGYTDREGEAVTVKALADYVKRFDAGRLPQYLDYAHGPVIGQIVAAEMWGPFLVEIAKELPTREARRRWDFIEATPFLDWACSQQFTASISDKSRGIFKEINKERSTVIRRSRAANPLTKAGIMGVKR